MQTNFPEPDTEPYPLDSRDPVDNPYDHDLPETEMPWLTYPVTL